MMESVLVGYDDTDASKRALERAAAIAKAFGSKLVVASIAPIAAGGGGRSAGPIDSTDTPKMHIEELHHAHDYLKGEGVEASYEGAVGDPADTIVELANTHGADLIVVGTREPNLVERLLRQSVSDSVAHKAHCDVLIVHVH
jgi:nucleotide-binding universal stress UspA family protein